MKTVGPLCAASPMLSACVGDGVEFGGADAPGIVPNSAVPCQAAGLKRVQDGRKKVPEEVVLYFMALQTKQRTELSDLTYDVNETGTALNIRFAGPPQYLRHATHQKLISVASEFLQTSRYAWPGTPGFATGCKFQLQYVIDWSKEPQSAAD